LRNSTVSELDGAAGARNRSEKDPGRIASSKETDHGFLAEDGANPAQVWAAWLRPAKPGVSNVVAFHWAGIGREFPFAPKDSSCHETSPYWSPFHGRAGGAKVVFAKASGKHARRRARPSPPQTARWARGFENITRPGEARGTKQLDHKPFDLNGNKHISSRRFDIGGWRPPIWRFRRRSGDLRAPPGTFDDDGGDRKAPLSRIRRFMGGPRRDRARGSALVARVRGSGGCSRRCFAFFRDPPNTSSSPAGHASRPWGVPRRARRCRVVATLLGGRHSRPAASGGPRLGEILREQSAGGACRVPCAQRTRRPG